MPRATNGLSRALRSQEIQETPKLRTIVKIHTVGMKFLPEKLLFPALLFLLFVPTEPKGFFSILIICTDLRPLFKLVWLWEVDGSMSREESALVPGSLVAEVPLLLLLRSHPVGACSHLKMGQLIM